jgi:hypothetical protein
VVGYSLIGYGLEEGVECGGVVEVGEGGHEVTGHGASGEAELFTRVSPRS